MFLTSFITKMTEENILTRFYVKNKKYIRISILLLLLIGAFLITTGNRTDEVDDSNIHVNEPDVPLSEEVLAAQLGSNDNEEEENTEREKNEGDKDPESMVLEVIEDQESTTDEDVSSDSDDTDDDESEDTVMEKILDKRSLK